MHLRWDLSFMNFFDSSSGYWWHFTHKSVHAPLTNLLLQCKGSRGLWALKKICRPCKKSHPHVNSLISLLMLKLKWLTNCSGTHAHSVQKKASAEMMQYEMWKSQMIHDHWSSYTLSRFRQSRLQRYPIPGFCTVRYPRRPTHPRSGSWNWIQMKPWYSLRSRHSSPASPPLQP